MLNTCIGIVSHSAQILACILAVLTIHETLHCSSLQNLLVIPFPDQLKDQLSTGN